MNISYIELKNKCFDVINSCNTIHQLEIAKKYIELSIKILNTNPELQNIFKKEIYSMFNLRYNNIGNLS